MPNEEMKPSIIARHVSKTYGAGASQIQALKDIYMTAFENELLMIVGPSGCGKTTLLSVIAGTLRFEEGEVVVLNQSLNGLTDDELTCFRRENIGFIFQQYHLIKTLTALENVIIPLLLNQISWSNGEFDVLDVLEKVGLGGRESSLPSQLSGGQQQRLAIARAIVHKPKLVICDEPTSALDAATGIAVLEILKKISKMPGRTVIVVTHDSRIFKFADRIYQMDDGRIINCVTNHEDLIES
ncbi:ABC-type transporter, ATPase subunit [Criblamydia sequanensis CRIB-18]|uniref:ABC-type transporter, ATPase subunit n=2 Tax=Candidatus Criblamydia sequanensis TaxID=340071 RepID=A0A090CYA9_9BACT|nr:ABC-type transporter, ATPase subunit [Criblamydia sequanensis CRIB-18]